ncbi:hypothetical protein O181_125910, partial [Austropuccinia psidii MF-1]|nr:hypothetical protein [Austropuccinia psidii MF-1]
MPRSPQIASCLQGEGSVIEKTIAEVRKLTRSAKNTNLPQYLHEAASTKDGGTIGCTKHQRFAAMSVAAKLVK